MAAVAERQGNLATVAAMTERIMLDAQRSFASGVDPADLKRHADEVIAQLWTESTTVTTFIPVLALRALRERLDMPLLPPQA